MRTKRAQRNEKKKLRFKRSLRIRYTKTAIKKKNTNTGDQLDRVEQYDIKKQFIGDDDDDDNTKRRVIHVYYNNGTHNTLNAIIPFRIYKLQ